MAVVALADDDIPFDEKDWIGSGKIFDWNKLPSSVTDAKLKAVAVPSDFASQAKLPQQNLSVFDFLAYELPRLSAELISTKTDLWFSKESANVPYDVIISRTIPSPEFVRRLEATCGQAWLDGAKSVVDHRFNDGKERLPLWIITHWRVVADLHEVQNLWKAGIAWLGREEGKGEGKTSPGGTQQARQLLKSLPWNSKMSYCNNMTSTPQLAQFLGTAWLTDEHINMMVEELCIDLDQKRNSASKVQILDLTFALEISRVHQKLALSEDQKKKLWLSKLQTAVEEGELEQVYFPLHINNVHWIAGMIDFRRSIFAFGDSLYAVGKGSGAPTKFVKDLQVWLKHGFGKKFKNQGNMLPHAVQPDQFSCPIITANTIAHAVFERPLWTTVQSVSERVGWFNRCASSQKLLASTSAVESSRRGISIADLLNPTPTTEMPDYDSESESESSSIWEFTDREDRNVDSPSMLADCGSSYQDSSAWGSQSALEVKSEAGDTEANSTFTAGSSTTSPWSKFPLRFLKRARSEVSDSDSGTSYVSDSGSEKPARKFVKAGDGSSKSAIASRTLRQQVEDGTFKVSDAKYKNWWKKILEADPDAKPHPKDIQQVYHPVCEKYIKVKEPYDSTRFRKHVQECVAKHTVAGKKILKTGSIFSMGFKRVSKPANIPSHSKPPIEVPCPGLTAADNPNIVRYLKRTGALGGGGRSLARIAKDQYNKFFSLLTTQAARKKVVDTQMHEWKWRNEHDNLRVYSTSCQKKVLELRSKAAKRPKPCSDCHTVLRSKAFKNALRRPVPSDKNFIFVNSRFRNSLLGKIFARTIGVREIVEAEDAKSSPYVRYAQGALRGDYNNEVFNGLLEAMVTKHDKEERGVHMQNFSYTPAWEEICHIIRTHSPRAYNALREYFPMPSERNIRKKEARQPRFPMDICDRTFELILEYLKGLDYDGPVGLSCDDTKLFSTFRLYWDAEKESYFLVGGIDGPLRVADPEAISEVIRQSKAKKATKSSREAGDILRIIIEGFISLIIIHRDHLPKLAPLLPWLHSSEACEHVFGEARRVVKDFTFLDFVYMIPKLRIKLHQAVIRGKSSDGKARAAGYSHTYFDHEGLDLAVLSTYPSDADIQGIAEIAAQEANSLVSLLGVNASILHLPQSIQPHFFLPSIDSWVDCQLELDGDSDSDTDEDYNEAEELQRILDEEEKSSISRSAKIDRTCLDLTSAALAITAEESAAVQRFAAIDEEEMDDVIAEENALSQHAMELSRSLPAVRIADEATRPLGHGGLQFGDLDFEMLVEMRRRHQTKQAATGVRTRKSKPQSDRETMRGQVIRKFHQALKEAQDEHAVGTGADRDLRWRGETAVSGNAANAAVVAASAAKKAAQRRKEIFTKAGVPRLTELIDARVTIIRPIRVGDFGFVLTANSVMLGRITTLSSKSNGKNGKHGSISESSSIAAVANVGVQLFQYRDFGRQFRSVPDTTAVLQTHQFFLHTSIQFLCCIETKLSTHQSSASFVELLQQDIDRYKDLKRGEKQLTAALKLAKKRATVDDSEE